MTDILKHFEKSLHGKFHPSTPDDYFALRLARGLGEPQAARHYAILASKYSQHKLLCAYQRAMSAQGDRAEAAKVFHDYLAAIPQGGGNGVSRPKLMAVRIERRCIGVGMFTGTHLNGFAARALAADHSSAENTAVSFLRASLSENDCPAIALETAAQNIKRAERHNAVVNACRADGISVWEISLQNVMEALSFPPPKSREEMRKLMLSMWPLSDLRQKEECALDALALGLYVQTERLFGSDNMNG